ncbi:hypothetical protein WJX74_002227 [Apatococcus lobatus]|uniref:Ysc84 actin-binding domain-containing protein n=1 Tax=Apatococcus lobatus TaxID=904363 RepID=A0AAW1RYC0_9CHLO
MTNSKVLLDKVKVAQADLDSHLSVNPTSKSKALTPETLRRGQAVAFQRIMKLGLVAGGSWGSGFVLAKIPCQNGVGFQWSAPSFYTIRGGSVGLTGAVESVHTVIVTASVAAAAKMACGSSFAGPGFDITFANDYGSGKTSHESHMNAGEILALTKIAGGFAIDVSFSGGTITCDTAANKAAYGGDYTPEQILSGAVEPPPEFQPIYQKLYAKMGTEPTSNYQAEASLATHTWNAAA